LGKGDSNVCTCPAKSQSYVRFLEKVSGAEIAYVSLGRSRDETILMDKRSLWKE
jgi:adenylosuccinate synthase